jgi:regulator of sirC expression with transglutaminase-like and TPR domain
VRQFHFLLFFTLLLSLFSSVWAAGPMLPEEKLILEFMQRAEVDIDLAEVKLAFDHAVDPSVDRSAAMKQIDSMVQDIKAMIKSAIPGRQAKTHESFMALRTYLYEAGPWNRQQVFSYNLDDPLGKQFETRLLSNYLETRKGNCISMPVLFVILGQRLGMDMTLAYAPYHFFVKLRDESGEFMNIEATSGGKPARDVYIQEQFNISMDAVKNGIYMKPLTQKENVLALSTVILSKAANNNDHLILARISSLLLQYDPNNVIGLTRKANVVSMTITEEFESMYPRPIDIPASKRPTFNKLNFIYDQIYARLASLGWQYPKADDQENYLKAIENQKSRLKEDES